MLIGEEDVLLEPAPHPMNILINHIAFISPKTRTYQLNIYGGDKKHGRTRLKQSNSLPILN